MNESQVAATAVAILRYLQRHPQSADTVEGIQQWWLESDENLAVVQTALEVLEADRRVERVRIGNRVLWRKPVRT